MHMHFGWILPANVRSAARTVWAAMGRAGRTITLARFLLALAGVYLALATGLLVSFLWPRTVHVSFASNNCFVNPLVLPGLDVPKSGKTYAAVPVNTVSLFGHTLYSHTTCLAPIAAPRESTADTVARSPFGFAPFHQTVRITTGTPPSVSYKTALAQPLSTKGPLVLTLMGICTVDFYRYEPGTVRTVHFVPTVPPLYRAVRWLPPATFLVDPYVGFGDRDFPGFEQLSPVLAEVDLYAVDVASLISGFQ